MSLLRAAALAAALSFSVPFAPAAARAPLPDDPDARAARVEAQMTDDERFGLLSGIMAIPLPGSGLTLPAGVPVTAGYWPGVPRLGVPALLATDASLGVVNPLQLRPGDTATALPSGLALAASFDPALAERAGAAIGREARARGFNVLLGGGVNLAFDPRNGRNFEYLGEDPLLAGRMAGAAIRGVQSAGVVSTIKHFALNAQETQRMSLDAVIDRDALREGELLAFQIGIEQGRPGAVMCAYNRLNGERACGNRWLLEDVLKRDWRFPGWVMSDWGAVDSPAFLLAGLDQQAGRQLDREPWFDGPLRAQLARGEVPRARLAEAVRRILRSVYAVGADRAAPAASPDPAAHAAVALEAARRGIVLLKNDGLLPLREAGSVLLVGDNADFGVLSGGGSSQVTPHGGRPRIVEPGGDDVIAANFARRLYMPSSPLLALRGLLPAARIGFHAGYSADAAAATAARFDVAIVFATRWEGEGSDHATLELPQGQDALIQAVAAANPRTIVVLQTGNPVAMPWLGAVAAVVQAWYPGQEGGRAIAEVLAGAVVPSGRLPLSFPRSLDAQPRAKLPGLGLPERTPLRVDYPEGSFIGYRRLARDGEVPLFAFGHGLSYTRFAHSAPRLLSRRPLTLALTVRNEGARAGADVPQLYLVGRGSTPLQRLVGFERVELQPGESRELRMTLDPRLLAEFERGAWQVPAGRYRFAVGRSAIELGEALELQLPARRLPP
ncbi:MAG: beta-glucosidase [Steroidobacteraceae bacterium]|nr:beta-glucosidase [Steroidobacteraceae bacterium]